MKSFAVATLAILLLASGAVAGTVTADFQNVSPGMRGTIYGFSASGPDFSKGVGTKAGVFNFEVDAVNGDTTAGALDTETGLAVGDTFKAYDLELQYINGASNEYTVKALEFAPVGASPGPDPDSTMGAFRADRLRKLWDKVTGLVGNPLEFTDAEQAAAFQLAAWAVVYDPATVLPNVAASHTSTAPGFWATGFPTSGPGNPIGLADTWLTDLDSHTGMELGLLALVDPLSQDFVILGPGLPPTGNPVPLPGSVWMGIALLSGLAAIRTRRRRRS